MPFDDPSEMLADIVETIARIDRYTNGMDGAAFAADQRTMDAVERCLSRISEAAIRLGPRGPELAPAEP